MLSTTQTPVSQIVLENAIARQDEHALRQELAKTNLSLDAMQGLLAQACQQKSSPAIQQVLRQSVLDLAVRHNDISIATQALQQEADPEKITASPDTDLMRSLLIYARRKNKLYPPDAPRDSETDLDRALRDGLDDRAWKEANKLLLQTVKDKDIKEGWRDAVKEGRLDIQRAILLLEYADLDRSFRLQQEGAVTDKGVAEVMKEIPYFSPKRRLLQNLNKEATFTGTNNKIVCRHLAEHWQAVQEPNPRIQFDYAQYASKEAIEIHVSYNTETKYNYLKAHATETRLFFNRDFGKTLARQLTLMETEGKQTRLIFLEATHHAMSVGLKIKEKDGKPYYVAKLFDPNRTTSHVRIASGSLHTFEMLTLKDFFAAENNLYKGCYPEPEGLSMMFVRPSPQEGHAMTDPAQGVVENRRLTSCIADKDIDATALFYMLMDGFAGDLRRLKGEIASRPEKERIQLLAAKNGDKVPGLYVALQNGHADTIKAFGELLSLVPEEECAELLAAKNANGRSGLAVTLRMGRLEALDQYIEIVMKIAPCLSAQGRAALLKDIRKSRAEHRFGPWWDNHQYYEALKKQNPDFCLRFEKMEKALKS